MNDPIRPPTELGSLIEALQRKLPAGQTLISSRAMRAAAPPSQPASSPGALVTFSGMDGSGKSSHCERTARRLRSRGDDARIMKYAVSRRPVLERAVEELLVTAGSEPPALLESRVARLIAADATVFVLSEVVPLLRSGIHVLSDRYVWDLLITLRVAFGVEDVPFAEYWHWLPVPDVAFLMEVDAGLAESRIKQRGRVGDRPAERPPVLRAKQQAYAAASRVLPLAVIDSAQPEELVEEVVWKHVVAALDNRGRG